MADDIEYILVVGTTLVTGVQFIQDQRTNMSELERMRDQGQVEASVNFKDEIINGFHKGDRLIQPIPCESYFAQWVLKPTLGAKNKLIAHGFGSFTSSRVYYEGSFQNDMFHDISGNAKLLLFEELKYTGGFFEGNRHGPGRLEKYDKRTGQYVLEFEGTFKEDKPDYGQYYGEFNAAVSNGSFVREDQLSILPPLDELALDDEEKENSASDLMIEHVTEEREYSRIVSHDQTADKTLIQPSYPSDPILPPHLEANSLVGCIEDLSEVASNVGGGDQEEVVLVIGNSETDCESFIQFLTRSSFLTHKYSYINFPDHCFNNNKMDLLVHNIIKMIDIKKSIAQSQTIKAVMILLNFTCFDMVSKLFSGLSQLFGDELDNYEKSILLILSQAPSSINQDDMKSMLMKAAPTMTSLIQHLFISNAVINVEYGNEQTVIGDTREEIWNKLERLEPRPSQEVLNQFSECYWLKELSQHFIDYNSIALKSKHFQKVSCDLNGLKLLSHTVKHPVVLAVLSQATCQIQYHFLQLVNKFLTQCVVQNFEEAEHYLDELREGCVHMREELDHFVQLKDLKKHIHELKENVQRQKKHEEHEHEEEGEKEEDFDQAQVEEKLCIAQGQVADLLELLAEKENTLIHQAKTQEASNKKIMEEMKKQHETIKQSYSAREKLFQTELTKKMKKELSELKERQAQEGEVQYHHHRQLLEAQCELKVQREMQRLKKAAEHSGASRRPEGLEMMAKLAESDTATKLKEKEVKQLADTNTINSRDEMNETALIRASRAGDVLKVALLIKYHADLDLVDKDGWSALVFAARWGHCVVVASLIANGALVNLQTRQQGYSALIWAAITDQVEIVKVLIDAGADVNLEDCEGRTAFYWARYYNNTECEQALISSFPQCGV